MHIEDENDNPPYFKKNLYHFKVKVSDFDFWDSLFYPHFTSETYARKRPLFGQLCSAKHRLNFNLKFLKFCTFRKHTDRFTFIDG